MQKIRKAVIAVSGNGTRFLPASKAVPKELVPILHRPVLEYIVDDCISAGIEEIIFISSPNKPAIEAHFGEAQELEKTLLEKGKDDVHASITKYKDKVQFRFVYQEKPLGTGHAILQAKDSVGEEPFVILYGDDFISGEQSMTKQMLDTYTKTGNAVLGGVQVPKNEVHKYGVFNVSDAGHFIGIVEKPNPKDAPSTMVSLGSAIAYPKLFDYLEVLEPSNRGEYELTDAWNSYAKDYSVTPIAFLGNRHDTGNVYGWLMANIAFGIEAYGDDFKEDIKRLLAS